MAKFKTPITELRFPTGGLNRAVAFDQTPPFVTPYCLNVRPYDPMLPGSTVLSAGGAGGMRSRGGSRPCLTKFASTRVSGNPVQLLASISIINSSANMIAAIVNGVFSYYASGTATAPGTTLPFATSKGMRGTQIGQYYYIADYRGPNFQGTAGSVSGSGGSSSLQDNALAGYSVDASNDFIFVSPADPTQANIFPVTSFNSGSNTVGFDTTGVSGITSQSGVAWQIGRMPKVFDPIGLTITKLFPTPIPQQNYDGGTVTASLGAVTLAGSGATWGGGTNVPSGVYSTPKAYNCTITLPNSTGIGASQYAVASFNSATTLTLIDTSTDANVPAGTTYTLSWTGSYYGAPPLGCPLCCTYRGRLVFAGPGPVWYMSRVLNPTDFDYGYDPNDPSRAVGGTATSAGGIPENILALIPHSDDYLIFGTERSLWLLNGDPAYGGTITALSREIGVLGSGAWCQMPDGSTIILSRDGLYLIPAGAQSYPQPLSRILLPSELLDVDYVGNTVSMAYDVQQHGVHISISPNAGGTGTHYFFDWPTKSFWPTIFGSNSLNPMAMVRYAPNSSSSAAASQIVFGGYDGYLRNYSYAATTDDGTAMNSLVCYGPFRFGGPGFNTEIQEIQGDLDSSSGNVSWGIYQDMTGEAAIQDAIAGGTASAAYWSGTWTSGYNSRQYPHARGAAFVIMLNGTAPWAIEGLRIIAKRRGMLR